MNNGSDETKKKILEEEFYINSKKYQYNILKYLKKNPSSPDNISAHLLCMEPKQIQEIYNSAVKKIRQKLNINIK